MGISERREREKERRREEIIDAAEKLFFEQGIEKTTMEQIAEQAELAKGTLYLYFTSKEDLGYAVGYRSVRMLNDMALSISSKALNAVEKLIGLGRVFVEFAKKHPNNFKLLMMMESLDLQQMSLTKEQIKREIYNESPIRMVGDFVQEGVREKLIRKDIPPEIIASTLWSQMIGVVQFAYAKKSLVEMSGFSPEQLFENHLEIVLNGIKAWEE